MFRFKRASYIALTAALSVAAAPSSAFAACLTTPGTTVGNPVFGATVQTFINLGINVNTTCIENGLWTNPNGFSLGSYVKGADGDAGFGIDNTVLGSYGTGGSIAAAANALDFKWVQDVGNQMSFGAAGVGGRPSFGIIWDLGGQANQLAVFVFVDHGPVPEEVLENTAWLSNDPNAADAGWTQAILTHVYGAGWSADPNVSDGFVAVYQLPNLATFRYASVTWGGPGAIQQDGDNEIDAVGGLNVQGGGIGNTVPEPMTVSLFAVGLVAVGLVRRRQRA
ncbi:MAG: PEP-CTERM sorting domain-containing protein [Gemmatimonadaceae bacterium]